MIIIASLLIGAAIGGLRARRLGGTGADLAQYAAVGALIGAMIGMFATVALERML